MEDIKRIIEEQRIYFKSGETKKVSFRMEKLEFLREAIIRYEEQIIEALKADFNKPPFEAYATEIGIVLEEIRYVLKNIKKWTKAEKVATPITQFKSTSRIYSEPYGIALIMAPWNYPFQLLVAPLIGAIAAGNCVVLKPSELAPNTSKVIGELVTSIYQQKFVAVVEGGIEVNKALLQERFDYIFFTGGETVGKIVMEAASRNLTPVTLELGGKSPCIVENDVNMELTARRIAWGKFLNAGQTCVAPDYILVDKSVKESLIMNLKKAIETFYGEDPLKSVDYARIINEKQYKRLQRFLSSGERRVGGIVEVESRYISPTILDNVSWEDPVMQEEIFGPILPILQYETLAEAIEMVNSHPKPLALYIFSNNKDNQQRVIDEISFGGGCINDTIIHLANGELPFGGVGSSGMGSYHGKGSFDTFSHYKSVLKKSTFLDIPLRYPPYKNKLSLLKKLLK